MNTIYVLVAEWPDRSGEAEIIRAFEFGRDAKIALQIAESSRPMMHLTVVATPFNWTSDRPPSS